MPLHLGKVHTQGEIRIDALIGSVDRSVDLHADIIIEDRKADPVDVFFARIEPLGVVVSAHGVVSKFDITGLRFDAIDNVVVGVDKGRGIEFGDGLGIVKYVDPRTRLIVEPVHNVLVAVVGKEQKADLVTDAKQELGVGTARHRLGKAIDLRIPHATADVIERFPESVRVIVGRVRVDHLAVSTSRGIVFKA